MYLYKIQKIRPDSKLILIVSLMLLLPFNLTADTLSVVETKIKIKTLIKKFHTIEKKHNSLFKSKIKVIEKNYYLLLNKTGSDIPPPLAPKDMFETQFEFNKRQEEYEKKRHYATIKQKKEIKSTHKKFNLRYQVSMAEIEYIEKKTSDLKPIINELTKLQESPVSADKGKLEVILFPPEADKYRFPVHFISSARKWTKYWNYTDKDKARALWKNKSYLIAELCSQFELSPDKKLMPTITTIRLSNSKTGDSRNYKIHKVKALPEIIRFKDMVENDLPAAKLMAALENVIEGPVPGMEFIYISPRSFDMGSPRSEPSRWANEVQHQVTLTKGFYIQTTEVTQGQWWAIMRNNPSEFSKCGSDCPVENMYWGEVQEFISRLNKLEKASKYRLPTEAEWEYACRAGNKNMGAHDDNEKKLKDYAWYKENSNGVIHSVASKKPNHWGLFDMQGNVSEWCNDWFGPYSNDDVTDPKGPIIGKFRVARGGNWQMSSRSCRAADRNSNLPGDRSGNIGFRLVINP